MLSMVSIIIPIAGVILSGDDRLIKTMYLVIKKFARDSLLVSRLVKAFSCHASFCLRPKENKALYPAHRVTKINVMPAAAKIIFLEHLKRKISSEILKKVDELDDHFKT